MSYQKFFNPEESFSRSEIEAYQLERLKATVKHCMDSPFYKERFRQAGLTPSDIQTLDDLKKIPFTTKQDLRETYPFGMAAVPLDQCVRLHSSSGTTGNPTVILHTQKDLEEWANAVARCLWMVGCRPEDVFQNTSGYGMFTGGLGFQYGAEKVGMLTVPAAAGNTLRQLKFFTDFGTTVVHAIPSYAARLYEVMCEKGIDPRKDTKLRTLVIGAEPHSEDTRKRIENMLGVKAYNSFGMSEMCGPGVAFECPEQCAAPASPSSAPSRTACTSGRTTTSSRSSIPTPSSPFRTARWASSSSRPSSARRCRCSATGRATSPASCRASAPAGAITSASTA